MHWLLWVAGGIIVIWLGLRFVVGPAAQQYLGGIYDTNKAKFNQNIRNDKSMTAKEKEEGIRLLDSWSSGYTNNRVRLAI